MSKLPWQVQRKGLDRMQMKVLRSIDTNIHLNRHGLFFLNHCGMVIFCHLNSVCIYIHQAADQGRDSKEHVREYEEK